ncbi:hypothetical protein NG798_06660 [Ancylothrix sp. C2]|uniref:hypothetical protein n=1 Tax=Ancylothrix sp. D3o TaxID=2953691 RepID=UPI0021BAAA4B|nr:hypothetical protein [Ancylothrix sp. D3o]MCT7949461.1 hypothetical protein [Ancylothrix sp. D3o]
MKLKVRPHPAEAVSILTLIDTLESLKQVSAHRKMPVETLLKLSIGQGLRQDLAKTTVKHRHVN